MVSRHGGRNCKKAPTARVELIAEKARTVRELGVPWDVAGTLTHAEIKYLGQQAKEERLWEDYTERHRLVSVFVLWANANRKQGSAPLRVEQFLRKPGQSMYPSQDDLSARLLGVFELLAAKE